MELILNNEIQVRPYVDTDYEEVVSLRLKEGDDNEVHKLGISTKEYFIHHLEMSADITNVFIYKGKIVGIIGLEDDNNLFFLTSTLDRLGLYCLSKHFNEVIEAVMTERETNRCFTWVDEDYTSSIRWSERFGMINSGSFYLGEYKFYIMTYVKES